MARDDMLPLIARLRQLTDAATDDEFNGVTFWTDDQLEDVLDRHSRDIQIILQHGTRKVNGQVAWWHMKYTPKFWIGFETYEVTDYQGYTVDTDDYVVDLERGQVTLDTGLSKQTYYLRARAYDFIDAAADVWQQKVNQRSSFVDYKADIHTVKMSQDYAHCIERLNYYASLRIGGFKRG